MTFPISAPLNNVLRCIAAAGGRPIIVGGAVRDYLLGLTPKDIDAEVYFLALEDLEAALLAGGWKVDAVGRSFGVLKVTNDQGETHDVSLPRTESKASPGHRGFVTTSDPHMSFEDAASRRDFTVNAIGWDYLTQEFLDPFNGRDDLAKGVLRHVGPAFAEDPLRVLRGCQFAARFGFTIAPETIALCRTLAPELPTLPVERVWTEWKKLLLSPNPSVGLYALYDTGALEMWPELKALLHVPQDPDWHPEGQDHPLGSLWVHNCMVVDKAALVIRDDDVLATEGEDSALVTMLGALCHDLGKPAVTAYTAKQNDPEGPKRWRAHGHEEAGVEPTRTFLARLGCPPGIVERVVPLVAHHLKPFHFARDRASDSAIRRLSVKAPLKDLCRVARADFLGRTTPEALACRDSREIPEILWLLERAAALKVDPMHGVKPFLRGRDLLALGLSPGPEMGRLIKASFEAQLDGVITDEATAVLWAREQLET